MLMPDNQTPIWHLLRANRAARDTANGIALDKLRRCLAAAERLAGEGHVVLDVRLGVGQPTVVLAASLLLASMADERRAAYWMRGVDSQGQHYRKGLLLDTGDVRVEWIERGN